MKKLITALLAIAIITSVATPARAWGVKETVGTLLGAVGGAALGSQIGKGTGQLAAVAGGTLLGAFLGREVGVSLDRADQMYLQSAVSQAQVAPLGQRISWNNPQSGNRGYVTPVRDGYAQSGSYCREYQNTIIVGGKTQQAYGQACRQPDGSWQIVSR